MCPPFFQVGDADPEVEDEDGWIGVVPLDEDQAEVLRRSKEESFTAAVVNKVGTGWRK